ncbi:MAG TPA: ATP-binding protein [Bacillota bacterium]|nr:ATP-binding protein [Bacillota bacterium]
MKFENLPRRMERSKQTSNSDKTSESEEKNSNFLTLPLYLLDWVEENLDEIILITNDDGTIEFISSSVERLLGYKKEELIGSSWQGKTSKENVKYILSNFDEDSCDKQFFIIDLFHRNGQLMNTMATIQKFIDSERNKVYYIASLKDITYRKETEKYLIQSEKMSVAGQLAAGIAHEIRNPLTSIKGFLQLLQAGVSRKEEYYKIMIEEIEKMEKITTELLFISKPMTDNKKWENVIGMLEDVIQLLQPQAKLKNIKLKYDCPNNEQIYCDRSQIKQVLINVVKNAIEAMSERGIVELNVHSNHQHVEIHIRDEGPGIPEEILHKLGEPFFTTKKDGTGLGIMITKQIMEAHGGYLEIKQNEPKGSTFNLVFPKIEHN